VVEEVAICLPALLIFALKFVELFIRDPTEGVEGFTGFLTVAEVDPDTDRRRTEAEA